MKALVIALTIFSTLLTGCDRQTLDGLRLRFQADFKSDYENSQPSSQTQPSSNQAGPKTEETPREEENWQKQPVREIKSESNPDEAPPFFPLEKCSKGDIVAQTNEIFYERHSQGKSIDSKDKKLMKEWQKIHAQVEQKCTVKE